MSSEPPGVSGQSVPGLLVEFVGLPAAGKTTLAVRLAEGLRELAIPTDLLCEWPAPAGAPYLRRRQKVPLALGAALRHPVTAAALVGLVLRSRQETPSDALRVLYRWLFLLGHRERGWQGVRVYDQGLVQALWSLLYRATPPEGFLERAARLTARLLPARTVLVLVRADEETWTDRLAVREPRSRLERARNGPGWAEELARARRCLVLVAACAREIATASDGGVRLVEAEGEGAEAWRVCLQPIVDAARECAPG